MSCRDGLDGHLQAVLARGGAGDRADRDHARRRRHASARLEEEAHGRAGGEGDVVARPSGRSSWASSSGSATRVVQRQHVDLGAALAERVGQHVARLGRACHEHAPPLDRHRLERLDERLGDRALAAPRRRDAAAAQLAPPCPGRSRRPSRPRARARRRRAQRRPSAARRRSGCDARRARSAVDAAASDSTRGSIRIAGASITSAPSAAQPRGQPARLRPRPRDGHDLAVQRPRLEPGERVAQLGDRADHGDRRRA